MIKVRLMPKQIEAIKLIKKETKLYLDDSEVPKVFINNRDSFGRKKSKAYIDFKTFSQLDFIGVVRYRYESFKDFYVYTIKQDLIEELLKFNKVE